MRIIFMGTPSFAVPVLQALVKGGHSIVGVYTQPDRPAGRGRGLSISSVKGIALQHQLPVFQPRSLRSPQALEEMRKLEPDVIIVSAYGRILPPAILEVPPHGCLNVHPSLLPRHRGPSPIQAAILAGDQETGVSIMKMDVGMDTGPVLAQIKVSIGPDDTGGTLADRLAILGSELLPEVLQGWVEGKIQAEPQNEGNASYSHLIQKEEGVIDWGLPAEVIWRQVRAFNPWPTAYTHFRAKVIKILEAYPLSLAAGTPGKVMPLGQDRAGVACGEGVLELKSVQLEGRRPMPLADYLRGQRDFLGSTLGK